MNKLLTIIFISGLTAAAYALENGQLVQGRSEKARSSQRPALFKDARRALAIARAQERTDAVLVIATLEGKTEALIKQVINLGGDVRYRADEIGYLRVRIPLDRVTELSESEYVEAATVSVDQTYPRSSQFSLEQTDHDTVRSQDVNTTQKEDWPPKLSDYPFRYPYSPLKDIDAEKFRRQNPTWDGRGVTIAILDGTYDMLLSEFQTAYALDGKRIPKTADVLLTADPRDDFDITPQWVDMKTAVSTRSQKMTFNGKTYSVPYDGNFRIGLLSEKRFAAVFSDFNDVDRNGNPKGDDGLFGVLWDEKTNNVWVDTNRDLSFTDEKAMADYGKRGDIGVLGKDNPLTPVRESMGFTIQTDRTNKFVAVNVGFGSHAVSVMGAVVGNREPNGKIDGIVPGARMVSIWYGFSLHGMIEGLVAAFRYPLVDLIVLEQNVWYVSEPYTLGDGQHTMSIIIQRLIDKYNKLLFVPGGNSSGFARVHEDGAASGAVAVGGYQSRDAYKINTGYVTEHYDNNHWAALSHGPSCAGGLKPDLLAPSGVITVHPGWREGHINSGLFELPSSYRVGGGTSQATPMAAGAAALVLSAAKQSGVKYDAVRLKTALTSSARFTRLAAHEQGNGLVQVHAAFEVLRKLQNEEVIHIETRAPVQNKLSHLFKTPNEGYGIYEREGWQVGDHRKRKVTFTRTSGSKQPMTFAVKWIGNDGTFSSTNSVTLPFNEPVEFSVSIMTKTEGAHSAILSLEHPSLPVSICRVLNTIVVPFRFQKENDYAVSTTLRLPAPTDSSIFVEVPDGVSALFASISPEVGYLQFISPIRSNHWNVGDGKGGESRAHIMRPTPGVWEINLRYFGREYYNYQHNAPVPLQGSSVTLTVRVAGIDVNAERAKPSDGVGTNGVDAALPLSVTLANRFGKVAAGVSNLELGSAIKKRATIAQGEQHLYEIIIPEGTTSLRAKVGNTSDPKADIDIYLLDCTESPEKRDSLQQSRDLRNYGAVKGKVSDPASGGEVEVPNPKPGRWVVVVDAYSVPNGSTGYDYMDVFTHPQFGAVSAADFPMERKTGDGWRVKGNVWINELPISPRFLHARVIARDESIRQQIPVGPRFWLPSDIVNYPIPLGSSDINLGEIREKQ